jgi:hypothetical protein
MNGYRSDGIGCCMPYGYVPCNGHWEGNVYVCAGAWCNVDWQHPETVEMCTSGGMECCPAEHYCSYEEECCWNGIGYSNGACYCL